MSAYKDQEYDFIVRTRKIIKQYDDYFKDKDKKEKFEITLLINAFVGLLILPQQHWFDNLPTDFVERNKWGIDTSHIGFIKSGEQKSVKEVARHLRNSIAHYRFVVFENKKEDISSIHFEDYYSYRDKDKKLIEEKTFDATIPISNLRLFLDKFSKKILDEMEIQKG